ncbi:hypothetical protein F4779DRAFT_611388 [Xylariaceae sp. FL0662B]|nr:hypothetical protein F4779DRAFT_611388 [Xylariaceae sp. FL0662B]
MSDQDPVLGRKPVGMLIYNPLGYMPANFMSSNLEHRPCNLTVPFEDNQSDTKWAFVRKHTLSYAAPFVISEVTDRVGSGQITHGPLEVAWVPSWVSTSLQNIKLCMAIGW